LVVLLVTVLVVVELVLPLVVLPAVAAPPLVLVSTPTEPVPAVLAETSGGGSGEVELSSSVAEIEFVVLLLLLPVEPPPQAERASRLAVARAQEIVFIVVAFPLVCGLLDAANEQHLSIGDDVRRNISSKSADFSIVIRRSYSSAILKQ